MEEKNCPFCVVVSTNGDAYRPLLYQDAHVIAFISFYPVSDYHTLIIPRRHIASPFEATAEEWGSIELAQSQIHRAIELSRRPPQGYILGINVGKQGGQTVDHFHYHIIPRYVGDVENPEGGIRNVIPSKGPYKTLGLDPEKERVKAMASELLNILGAA
jgi:diadenosine tetraphosphate (Ap4A) HIT family hydrolase